MIEAHLRKLRLRDIVSSEEAAALRSTVSYIESFSTNAVLARAGKPVDRSLLVLNGWLCRSKELPGYERQITSLCIAGDFADLHGLVLGRLDHDVTALTDCQIAIIRHDRFQQLFEDYPHLARIYHLMGNIDASIEREWSVSLGRRSRTGHIAHLFCELLLRLDAIGRAAGASYEFPLTQHQLADCLGATPIHVNRVLQDLRGRGLIRLEHRRLTILDHEGLRALARFDPAYLFMEKVCGRSTIIVECSPSAREHPIGPMPVASSAEIAGQP